MDGVYHLCTHEGTVLNPYEKDYYFLSQNQTLYIKIHFYQNASKRLRMSKYNAHLLIPFQTT